MQVQFKKGVLELVVLMAISRRDMYGYEIVSKVSPIIDVGEGTIYPLLKRLTNERYFDTYLVESSEGPPRKYYRLTPAGALHMHALRDEWLDFTTKVQELIKEGDPF